MVTSGVTVSVDPVEESLHKYVPPAWEGVASKIALDPLHIEGEFTVTVGKGFTIIAPEIALFSGVPHKLEISQ